MEKKIQFINATEGFENQIIGTTGAVIIGDRTFGLTSHPYQYDLAEEWQNFTGLPFVFACWVSNVPLEEKFINEYKDEFLESLNNPIAQCKFCPTHKKNIVIAPARKGSIKL